MSDLFGEQFYPTPQTLVWEMVKGLDLRGKKILDPEAGDGAILDAVKSMVGDHYRNDENLFAIEKDPSMRAVLNDKGYAVIDSDFLQYGGYQYFDFILMNPPFAHGREHLLKAWEISQGATIKCLLNAETVRGYDEPEQLSLTGRAPKKNDRLHHLIRKHGEVRYLGRPFKNGARRPTDVEVVLVTLVDDGPKESFRLDFEPEFVDARFKVSDVEDVALAPADAFESFAAQYDAAIAAFKKLLLARQETHHYMQGIKPEYCKDLIADAMKESGPDAAFSVFVEALTKSAWDALFVKTRLASATTESVRREIEKLQAAQGKMAFTTANMHELMDMLTLNRKHIMLQCILEVFDELTKFHQENRVYVEGWKTNSAYFVPKKFILPYVGSNWGDGIDYSRAQTLADIERALCFLDGIKFEDVTCIGDLYRHQSHYGRKVTSTFFETQLFKKGTMHFWWRDESLRNRFNAVVAKERWGWLPEKIKVGKFG